MQNLVLLLSLVFPLVYGHEVRVVNNCPFTVWPTLGVFSGSSDVTPQFESYGLKRGDLTHFHPSDDWYGWIWARTNCTSSGCETGDCSTEIDCKRSFPVGTATVVGIRLNQRYGGSTSDKYFINIQDGFNVPATVTPIPGTIRGKCGRLHCSFDLQTACPKELVVKNSEGATVSCISACKKFNTDDYCCRGTHGKCKSSKDRVPDYARMFKQMCPEAQARKNDVTSQSCTGLTPTSSSYEVRFC